MTETAAVIPAYNEQAHIQDVLERVEATGLVDHTIVVDDCSTDHTAARVEATDATLLSNERNRDYGGAIKRGYERALELDVDLIFRLDADGQHDPAELRRFRRALQVPDCQYVLGNRFADPSFRETMPFDRRFGNRVVALATSVRLGHRVTDPPCGYRAMDAAVLAQTPYQSFSDDFRIGVEEILAFDALGAGFDEVPVSCIYADEESHLGYYDGLKFLYPSVTWWNRPGATAALKQLVRR
ncbi:glycosyltransferase family 2 protein [Natronorubrum sulfidifaciens]|uniref:Dolichyl-phosphate mannose synthase-like protein n=1 Tax=Natronorubrum sulfidifaciens JCM 14089 TaxID=1230460 RepID=L9VYL3_9EURY|nr:glycosyltransferase family 2 protein [Natronorubrum sulfidifaciens]ELY42081.1 dolichyl-phosphate mannose synthase-like protein [Natronorubrum sulfidifaciens JCM 14089]